MKFTETELRGTFLIVPERHDDDRGFFARTFCQHEFAGRGLDTEVAQASFAFNTRRGTLRGMHFQYPPAAETKVVRCTRGSVLDVIVDLRPESPTYLGHLAVELSAENRLSLYVPKRFAHGYQTLEDDTEVSYQMSEFYAPELAAGLAYDDPRLGLRWPLPITAISPRDRSWPRVQEAESRLRHRMAVAPAGSHGAAG
jgi:dTDP-4-dehydrorhamnose 3,5-epimerase